MPEAPGVEPVEPPPRGLWKRVHEDPIRAPEHIALAAAERFAPPAERWVSRMRDRHPPAELARLARRRHVQLSRVEGGAAGLGGAFTVVPDVGALAWIQGRMVFFVAAALGFDARHPMRPAELLTLQGIYTTPADARAALDGLGVPLALQYIDSRLSRERQLARRLLKLVGRQVTKRTVMKVVPILSVPVSAGANGRATARLGDRTLAYYGGHAAAPPLPSGTPPASAS